MTGSCSSPPIPKRRGNIITVKAKAKNKYNNANYNSLKSCPQRQKQDIKGYVSHKYNFI